MTKHARVTFDGDRSLLVEIGGNNKIVRSAGSPARVAEVTIARTAPVDPWHAITSVIYNVEVLDAIVQAIEDAGYRLVSDWSFRDDGWDIEVIASARTTRAVRGRRRA